MVVEKVSLHRRFESGEFESSSFKDFQFLTPGEVNSVLDFSYDAIDGKKLPGRNKPSWEDRFGNPMAKMGTYQQANIWHYHSGPYSVKPGTHKSDYVWKANYQGKTSEQVIHYTWNGSQMDHLVILGFSPQHIPFPAPGDKGNPLRARSKFIYSDAELIELDELLDI